MNSSVDITRCVVPLRDDNVTFSTTSHATLNWTRSYANAGHVMQRTPTLLDTATQQALRGRLATQAMGTVGLRGNTAPVALRALRPAG